MKTVGLIPQWCTFCPDSGCRGLPWVLTSLDFGGSSYVLAAVLFCPVVTRVGLVGADLLVMVSTVGGGWVYGLRLPHPPDIYCWVCEEV